jgi:3'-phosphoadenosine 5'-phosphosulfate sulfotransferase (PAPS reductase)/FAD synthetase
MDWPVTPAYIRAFAQAENVRLRVSWRVNGFWGEVYRLGASWPIKYEDDGDVKTCRLSEKQIRSMELREKVLDELEQLELKTMGNRMKFPAKSGDLAQRWCSAYLKITVADTVIRNIENLREIGERNKFPAKSGCHQGRWCSGSLKAQVESGLYSNIDQLRENTKILVVSGERRGESAGRARYNEMEIHRTNAMAKAHRLVHQWRAVIDYTERDIWEVLKRHRVNPHPCYSAGWNRCSCMMCIFSLPKHWAGIRELFPEEYEAVKHDEEVLDFTLDNKKTLDEYVGAADSCVNRASGKAIQQILTGVFDESDIYAEPGTWDFPAGAFGGSEGGPC